jgi:menaquinone-specific isochorismate synthase
VRYIQRHPGHLYGTWNAQEGILGVTPETLFAVKKELDTWTLKSHALAGTAPTGESCLSPKLIHEHQVVVDGITQALSRLGKPQIGPLQTLDLPHLRHLMTPIEMQLTNRPAFEQIVQALHPTPALGAHPIESGRRWLLDYQKHFDRLRFGAPVGYFDPTTQNSRCFVAIRNVQWQPHRMLLGAGCGIVADSDPESEWNEILLKLKAIKAMLNL